MMAGCRPASSAASAMKRWLSARSPGGCDQGPAVTVRRCPALRRIRPDAGQSLTCGPLMNTSATYGTCCSFSGTGRSWPGWRSGCARMHRDERVDLCGYADQALNEVLAQVEMAAELCALVFDRLDDAAWQRRLIYNWPAAADRDLAWLGRHTVHEVEHHLQDVAAVLRQHGPLVLVVTAQVTSHIGGACHKNGTAAWRSAVARSAKAVPSRTRCQTQPGGLCGCAAAGQRPGPPLRDAAQHRKGRGSPVIGCAVVRPDRVVCERSLAAVRGPRRAPVGVSAS